MAVRIRKDGRIFCAAMHPEEAGDIYVDDAIHYELAVNARVLVTDNGHLENPGHGQWWWVHQITYCHGLKHCLCAGFGPNREEYHIVPSHLTIEKVFYV